MKAEKVTAKIQQLQPLLDLSGFALKYPDEEELAEVLGEADYWLEELINDFMPTFNEVYDLDHTGIEFWDNVKILGLQDDYGIMSDLQVCIDMRKILKKFRKRCIKNLPILFGGVRSGNAKAKAKAKT